MGQQRCAFDRVIEAVHSQFDGRIEARRIDEGRKDYSGSFYQGVEPEGNHTLVE